MEHNVWVHDEGDVVLLVGCSLDRSPGKNWVENSGGLPEYICRIARAIHRSGHSISNSIQIAISRVKAWASGRDDVDPDTRAKAAKAVAQWEALKAKNKVKKGAKKAANAGNGDGGRDRVKTTAPGAAMSDLEQIIALAAARGGDETDLGTILRLAGKPNPFAAKGGDMKAGMKAGMKDSKKAPPFGKKPGGNGGGDNASGGGLNSAAAVKAAWAKLKANRDLTPEQYAAQASRIKAVAKKFNVELG